MRQEKIYTRKLAPGSVHNWCTFLDDKYIKDIKNNLKKKLKEDRLSLYKGYSPYGYYLTQNDLETWNYYNPNLSIPLKDFSSILKRSEYYSKFDSDIETMRYYDIDSIPKLFVFNLRNSLFRISLSNFKDIIKLGFIT